MKISILTPSFNAGKYIERAIQSVLNQDYEDWEHIIVDGGSTDGTSEILKKYSHLKWISEPDNGIYDAMNKAVEMTSGDWVYFLGADDQLKPGVLRFIADTVKNTKLDVIYGNVWSTRFGGRHDGEFDYQKLFKKNICHQSIFLNRHIFESVGRFSTKYKSHADWDHNLRWFLNPMIKYKYVDHVFADYADGGFSSLNPDQLFARDKRFNFIKYGWKTAPTNFISRICKQEVRSKDSSLFRRMSAVVYYVLAKLRSVN